MYIAQEESRKFSAKLNDIASFNVFGDAMKTTLSTLTYHFNLIEYNQNNILFKENDESDFIYFIKTGEFKVSINN